MATTETTTPPERCPVCGWVEDYRNSDEGRVTDIYYNCGAHWVRYSHGKSDWVDHCPHAMTAALRCGATLEPSPLEQARLALVEAASAWRIARRNWDMACDTDLPAMEHMEFEVREHDAAHVLQLAVAAYRALLDAKP